MRSTEVLGATLLAACGAVSDSNNQQQLDALVVHTVTVTVSGNGMGTVSASPAGIECPGDCGEAYAAGVAVTLTATAGAESTFTGWSGGCTGTAPCTITPSADTDVTATFAKVQYALSLTKNGGGLVTSNPGGINCGVTCSASFDSGTMVTLTAAAGTDIFAGWSGPCAGTAPCTVTMTAATAATARFVTPLSCNTVGVSACTNGTAAQINLGQGVSSGQCHDRCQVELALAGLTSGCWVLSTPGDGNCYCRSGTIVTTTPTATGGACLAP